MKKTYYLFNPGRLSRKDNTLIFTPVDETGMEQKPRFIPIEMVDQLYVFGSLDANSALFNFLGKNQVCVHFFDYYENSFPNHQIPNSTQGSQKISLKFTI